MSLHVQKYLLFRTRNSVLPPMVLLPIEEVGHEYYYMLVMLLTFYIVQTRYSLPNNEVEDGAKTVIEKKIH